MKKALNFLFLISLSLISITAFGQAKFTADNFSGCSPLSVQFTDQSTCSGPCGWSWNLGNGNTSALQHPSAQYNTAGTYTVTLTINGGSTATHTIVVFQSPTAKFYSNGDTTCVNGTVTFNDSSILGSAPIVKYKWSFGDGTADSTSGKSVTHSFTLAGTFNINLVVFDANGCQSPSSQNTKVVVMPAPNPLFNFTPLLSCTFPSTVTFTNLTSPAAVSYKWKFGDPSSGASDSSTLINPTHTYTQKGQYQITLTAQTGSCKNQISSFFTIPIPGFTVSSDTICRYSSVAFTNTSIPTPSQPKWYFGDPASGPLDFSTLLNPVHFYGTPGSYVVTMVPSNGCGDTVRKTIFVRQKPTINFTVADSNFCKPSTVQFQITGTPALAGWQLYFEDSAILFKDSIYSPANSYTFTGDGSYKVRLIATDIYGCIDTLTKPKYINIQAPTVNITTPPDSGCYPKQFTFNSATTLVQGDTITQYMWDFGDGTKDSISGSNASHTYTTCKIDTVSLTIKTKKGCSATSIKPGLVRTGSKPVAGFSWQPSIMCYGDTVQFTDTSKTNPDNCKITAWSWDFGSTEQNPMHVFPDTGKWSVTLSIYSNGCKDSVRKDTIIRIWPPKPIFTYIPPNCTNHNTVQFNDISHGDEWIVWTFGDGTPKDSTNNQNPTHTFPGRGQYWVKLTAYNFTFGCHYSDSQLVIITAPRAIITGTLQGCHPFFTTLNGGTSVDGVSYSWDFGDPTSGNNSSTFPVDTHTFVVAGTYAVKLTITDMYGCVDDTTVIYYSIGPTSRFQASSLSGCRPLTDTLLSTSLTQGGAITKYFWNFNYPSPTDTLTSTVNPVKHTYLQNGIYTVMLVTTDVNGCKDTLIKTNYINVTFPSPQFVNPDTFVCDNSQVHYVVFANGSGPFTYHWSFGDGQPDSITSNSASQTNVVSHTYLFNDTTFLLSVKVTDANGCDSTIRQNILVLRPSAIFTSTQVDICGSTVPKYVPPVGDSITNWVWNISGPFGFMAGSTITDPAFQFTIPGKYYTSLTVTNPGCPATFTDTGIVVPGPQAYFTDTVFSQCPPVRAVFTSHLTNSQKYDFIKWDFGDGTSGTVNYPDSVITHIYHTDGTYNPSAQISYTLPNGQPCAYQDTNLSPPIVVIKTFAVGISPTGRILLTEGEKDTLDAVIIISGTSIPPYTYIWNAFPSGTTLPVFNTTQAIYTAAGNDTMIVLTVRDASGCEAYDTVFVTIKFCEQNLKIPNVFTPNGDSLNETYFIDSLCPIEDFKVTIYNRWGNIVYESSLYNFHWDGKDDNGKDCSEGVYYYIMHTRKKNLNGYIHLIRG